MFVWNIVRKGVPAPSLLRHPPFDHAYPLPFLLKIFVSPRLFSIPLPFKVLFISDTNFPYTQLTGLNKFQKSDTPSSTLAF